LFLGVGLANIAAIYCPLTYRLRFSIT